MSNQARVQVNDAETGGSFTGNPKAPKPTPSDPEAPGTITSDSLAAESLSSGGSFADGKAAADGTPSKSSTAATTDTSAARTIEPAASKATRGDGVEDVTTSGGVAGSGDVGPPSVGSGAGSDVAIGGSAASGTTGGSTASGGAASGTSASTGSSDEGEKADFSGPNASFNNAEIGSKNDPGRLAELGFERANAAAGGDAGYEGANETELQGGKGGFENLGETSA